MGGREGVGEIGAEHKSPGAYNNTTLPPVV